MSEAHQFARSAAAELRRAFDESFALPISDGHEETEDYLCFRLGETVHAVRLSAISGMYSNMTIVPCPSPLPELLGLAGFRGAVVPVYDLALLLGLRAVTSRWLLLAADRSVAFAFDAFESHIRVSAGSVIVEQRSSATNHLRAFAKHDGAAIPVIDFSSLLSTLKARAANANPRKD